MKPVALLGIALLSLSIFALFQVKYKVQHLRRDLAEIERQTEADKKSIHVLKAEWAYLNRPERLKQLADRYLDLRFVNVAQVRQGENVTLVGFKQPAHKNVLPQPKPLSGNLRLVSR